MQLSTNFFYSEFCDRDHHILTLLQIHMLSCLAIKVLQPIRDFLCQHFNKDIVFTVRSGVRFPSDLNRLKREGYNPSETSDHLFGNVIKLQQSENIAKYGKFYPYSVGAADVVPLCGAKEAWEAMRPMFQENTGEILLPSGSVKIGQLILERRNSYWLHISNPVSTVYSEEIANTFLKKTHFLLSSDNGRTYQIPMGVS